MTFKHYLLTRFNLGLYSHKQKTRGKEVIDPEKWMEDRINLFKKYCAPSVLNQRCQNFIWIIVIDNKTPHEFTGKIFETVNIGNVKLVEGNNFRLAAKEHIGFPDVDRLITTRMDNDDAIHKDYIKNIQLWFGRKLKTGVLSAPSGWIWSTNKDALYHVRYVKNPFTSLIEKCDKKIRTILSYRHTDVTEKYRLHYLQEPHQWCQIVHGKNLANYCWGHKSDMNNLVQEEYWK